MCMYLTNEIIAVIGNVQILISRHSYSSRTGQLSTGGSTIISTQSTRASADDGGNQFGPCSY